MPPALKTVFASLKHFLLTDSPTDYEARAALNIIYMLCFGAQAVLSLLLAVILAILSQTMVNDASTVPLTVNQSNNISQIMLFSVMVLLLPSALLIASLWQRQTKQQKSGGNSVTDKKNAKVASIASTIAVAVILAISVWICVFAYFISINLQVLLLLVVFSMVLYFTGFIATGIYAKSATKLTI